MALHSRLIILAIPLVLLFGCKSLENPSPIQSGNHFNPTKISVDWGSQAWSKWITTRSEKANQIILDNATDKKHTLEFEFINIGSKNDGAISILYKSTDPSSISRLTYIDPGDTFCMEGRYHFIAFIIEKNGGLIKWRRRLTD